MRTLVRSGTVVTATDEFVADVLVEEGRIAAIGADLDVDASARVIEAEGCYVLPGAVDPHTHTDTPQLGTATCDDFTAASVAAASGGTTTQIDFALQEPGQSLHQAIETWHGKLADAPPVIDVGFHVSVTDLDHAGSPAELAELPGLGVTSFKLFMAYRGSIMVDDSTLFRAMQVAARVGALVMVHAENGAAIDVLMQQALAEGRTAPRWHAATRPPATEGEAVNRAIQLAGLAGAPLYVVHVSCREALDPIARARRRGMAVWAETCPQYLMIDRSALDADGLEGAKYVFTPPPREQADRDALWQALATDVLDVVSTDHCPFRLADQKAMGIDDFSKIPNGAPGIEHRLPLLHHFGVRGGRLSMPRMVDLLATRPARLFGLYPRKGTLAVGSDADLVVFDPEHHSTISAATQRTGSDYSIFEGVEVEGFPRTVMVRGQVVIEDGELVVEPGHGTFVRRARFGERLPIAAGVA